MTLKLPIAGLFCLVVATACGGITPTGPSAPLNQPFTLAPGEAASVANSPLSVRLLGVVIDSRCPADAFCVTAGDAIVEVIVQGDRTTEYELHTNMGSRASTEHEGWRIALLKLEPYPYSGRTIRPEEYRATLTVTR